MFWNSKHVTYYDRGRRAYSFGDEIPAKVIEKMGKETLDEYIKKGLISAGKVEVDKSEIEADPRDVLFEKVLSLGLKPHCKAKIPKLTAMIEDHEALQALKQEALSLGIDPSDDVTLEELTLLVSNKKADLGLSNPHTDPDDSNDEPDS